jgi:hypothetical protein
MSAARQSSGCAHTSPERLHQSNEMIDARSRDAMSPSRPLNADAHCFAPRRD